MSEPAPEVPATRWQELKRRKIVQWALAYLAGAWVVLEVTSLVGGHFGWPDAVHRALIVVAAAGLPLSMVLAWYHGEKGRQRVSGPELLIVASLFLAAGAGVRLVWSAPAPGEERAGADMPVPERSIAVLPLDNLSRGDEHAFFAAAMTEEITSALSEVPDLTVKSRNSASQFDASAMTVSEFARTIGVAHVIEGSVQRADDEARITVQLIDAATDDHLWTATYEPELADLFDVQVEVARQVADRLAATFTEREQSRILAGATDDPVAYDLYLQALTVPIGSEDRADDLLRRAARRDPGFWPAWERLAFAYLERERRGEGPEWADSSRLALERAIRTADDSAARLRLQAYEAMIFGDAAEQAAVEERIARLRAAAETRPSDVRLAASLGDLYRLRGRLVEAARWRRRAALLDPLQPEGWQDLFQIYWWVGLYDDAERVLRRALEADPHETSVWPQFVWLRMMEGRKEAALAAADSIAAHGYPSRALFHRTFALWWMGDARAAVGTYASRDASVGSSPPSWYLAPFAHAHFTAGEPAVARRIGEELRALVSSWTVDDYEPELRVFLRLQLAALDGDTERAVDLFRRYVERGGRDPTWFASSPLFSELRENSAFRAELEALERQVADMRRRIERDLRESRPS